MARRTPSGERGRLRAAAARERGYNLVILMVLIAVLTIGLAAVGPYWSKIIQREKEEELIFRGMQYAEAIRVFQQRFGRPPNRLEELLEVEPRSIRQLWKDPMTKNGRWAIVFGSGRPGQPGQPGQPGGVAGGQGSGSFGAQGSGPGSGISVQEWAENFGDPEKDPDVRRQVANPLSVQEWEQEFQAGGGAPQTVEEWQQEFNQPGAPVRPVPGPRGVGSGQSVEEWAQTFPGSGGSGGGSRDQDEIQVGPIQGVSSRSDDSGYRIFRGNEHYNQWRFTAELLPGTQGPDGQPRTPFIGTSWMTRNLPTNLAQQGSGGAPKDLFGDPSDKDADGFGDAGESDDPGEVEEVAPGSDDPFDFDIQSDQDLQDLEDLFLDDGGDVDDPGGG